MVAPLWLLVSLALGFAVVYSAAPHVLELCGRWLGTQVRSRARHRRELLLARVTTDREKLRESASSQTTPDEDWEKVYSERSQPEAISKDHEWTGVIGFFHPFCNAGGGGERVLWAAIRVTQQRWPNALCVVYTGDHEVNKEQILQRVEERFNITLQAPTIAFLYLSKRHYVLSSTWPRFTLLGQSLGSLVLGYDAFSMLPPDIFVDTMGYAFATALCKFLFPNVPTGAYVHYPTISTDMLESLAVDASSGRGLNAGAGKGWKGQLKKRYWHAFAWLYGKVGGSTDIVMTNSSWTQDHIQALWGKTRQQRKKRYPVEVVFPPVAVEELEKGIEITRESEEKRRSTLLYIAQFRPEKNHALILRSFAQFLKKNHPTAISTSSSLPQQANSKATANDDRIPNLTLIGSVRDTSDEKHIYSLRLLAHELHITQHVNFLLNVTWDVILSELRTASIGVNGMWNEHFGIGVVEYQAAGLIGVVHDSGGPKRDICVAIGEGIGGSGPTGLHASDADGFAAGFEQVLKMSPDDRFQMRLRARRSSQRFSGKEFDEHWLVHMERLVREARKAPKP